MSTLREAAQQALEALESCSGVPHWPALQPTITAIRAAQQEQDTDCHAQGICQRSGYGIGTITPAELSAALGWPGGISTPVLDKGELLRMVAQQEQEPSVCARCGGLVYDPVWVAQSDPPRREWRGLTEEEHLRIIDDTLEGGSTLDVARAIEQACKERNNG